MAWPLRSPDLTSLDFFLWGYVKNIIYHVKMKDLQHLKALIRDIVTTVTPNMLQTTWKEVELFWISVVSSREPTLIFIEKVIYSEKNFDKFPFQWCNP
jgi:hypothetical protein